MSDNSLTIKLLILPHGKGLTVPGYATADSAGMDLRAAIPEGEPLTLAPGERGLIPTGITLAIPQGWEGQVRPRSGLAIKKGITVLNAPGTIDADYRGEVGVILINHGDRPVTIERGERIAQILFAPVVQAEWHLVPSLDRTQRQGGFGSTGL
ncbi:MAG: dUTP diphosphatase [Magnetococcales bacterium]|nr:dUTP diphosphatase [Magnetococcales bacterium]